MEEAAERVVRTLYDQLIDAETGARSCALVRFFKTHAFGELESDLRDFAREALHDERAAPTVSDLVNRFVEEHVAHKAAKTA